MWSVPRRGMSPSEVTDHSLARSDFSSPRGADMWGQHGSRLESRQIAGQLAPQFVARMGALNTIPKLSTLRCHIVVVRVSISCQSVAEVSGWIERGRRGRRVSAVLQRPVL